MLQLVILCGMPAGQPLTTVDPATNPRLATLLAFWQSLRQENGLVAKRDFNPFALQPWLGFISLFEKVGDDFIIRLDGSEIVRMTGEEWTGRRVSEADKHYKIDLIASLRIMEAESRPIFHPKHFIATKPFMTVGRLILPLSNDGATITHAAIALLPNAGSQMN
ncbi:PAS domain-containing protein [Lacibacterium aquatile]|uniref:PAS domain-containing protein n=1 Tax=Lacibacterium aquatile TaxID=1168082 RepID=A0ABW5DWW1_9PROT